MTVGQIKKDKTLKTGLSSKEAISKIKKYGPNIIISKSKISAFKILLSQFQDFMIAVLIAATLISALMGELVEAITIFAIIFVNAVLGFIQEYKTEKTLEALKSLAGPECRVYRDGAAVKLPAAGLVPGDLIKIEEGDRIPADALLVEANNLNVDESLLTGESIPVIKTNDDGIYMGTVITRGRGAAVVTATGMSTAMGEIAHMIHSVEDKETPLQKKLDILGKYIVYGCIGVCAIVAGTGILRGENIFSMLLSGISLAVAAVPEGLPAVVTISLALGVQKMLRRKALVRKLPAVETLGCADIICSDKTGTLTQNQMTLRKIYSGDRVHEYEESNQFKTFHGYKPVTEKSLPLYLTMLIAGICNNAEICNDIGTINGEPTEAALLKGSIEAGLGDDLFKGEYIRTGEIPFDSLRKRMSVTVRKRNKNTYLFTKGAPDFLLERCSHLQTDKGIIPMTTQKRELIVSIINKMASEALRVMAMAYKELNYNYVLNANLENNLIFTGLAALIDPPRKETRNAVIKCKQAGIKPVMITGDHTITACAIAKELLIYEEGDVVITGSEIDKINDAEFLIITRKASVYSRVSPGHKLKIVKALKASGHIVAMTGDGVNDAPAVKEADIGIAMGISGTDVTREAASMILQNDNFATIVAAVEEGRVIYGNIRKFIRYLLSCNIGEVLTMFFAMLSGLPLPLLPIQILWINLVTDGLPAIALSLEPGERDIMRQSPRRADDNVFSGGLAPLIIVRGVLLCISTLGVFTSLLYMSGSLHLARTGAFVTLVITQLIHVFECKSERKTLLEMDLFSNKYLIFSVACSAVMILAAVYLPFMQLIFRTVPLSFKDWLLIAGFSMLGPAFGSILQNIKYKIYSKTNKTKDTLIKSSALP